MVLDAEGGQAKLRGEALGVLARLEALHPNRRYVLVYEAFEKPVRDGRSWLVLPRAGRWASSLYGAR